MNLLHTSEIPEVLTLRGRGYYICKLHLMKLRLHGIVHTHVKSVYHSSEEQEDFKYNSRVISSDKSIRF